MQGRLSLQCIRIRKGVSFDTVHMIASDTFKGSSLGRFLKRVVTAPRYFTWDVPEVPQREAEAEDGGGGGVHPEAAVHRRKDLHGEGGRPPGHLLHEAVRAGS